MSIVTEINRIKQNIANAYTELQSKSATMPATQNSANLANTISTISSSAVSNLTKITVNVEDEKLTELISNNAIEITLPASKTNIDDSFKGWSGLTGITIGDNITRLEGRAFQNCTNLQSLVIPNNVTSTGVYICNGCTGLTTVSFGNGLSDISGGFCWDCSNLTSVTIPRSITRIQVYPFYNCTSLENVNYLGTKEEWGQINLNQTWKDNSSISTITCTDGVIEV